MIHLRRLCIHYTHYTHYTTTYAEPPLLPSLPSDLSIIVRLSTFSASFFLLLRCTPLRSKSTFCLPISPSPISETPRPPHPPHRLKNRLANPPFETPKTPYANPMPTPANGKKKVICRKMQRVRTSFARW
ncbi:hypothetical protein K491DRAFT_272203 [Lophiostoma macrostomum CBS 122681]|uniref:Uncharacterized protein n=1 Tax=Lophiostoma macrostomum CBS 122681 TaxID=1314788 RepID=A0A6A6SNZ1_9PLEO|nr:hypothetical protein K491DRAFT_272203 [Lophiostoma macrostomum CBS 122681]